MAKKRTLNSGSAVSAGQIERAIHVVRGQRVILDAELAQLYGVTTAALNQAVKRNAKRFPGDFAFQLSTQDFASLKSQIVISKTGRGGRSKRPWAFTEHGVAMLSSFMMTRFGQSRRCCNKCLNNQKSLRDGSDSVAKPRANSRDNVNDQCGDLLAVTQVIRSPQYKDVTQPPVPSCVARR